jgi:TetR/AcrR family transcriptional regulator, transcriptional repressor for nem operon
MPRPANPHVRSRLLSKGQEVVYARGFHGTGVHDITAAAGVPKGSFYSYFDSKDAFAAEILEEYGTTLERVAEPLLYDARLKPLKRIRSYFRSINEYHAQNSFMLGCLMGNLALELSNTSEATRRKIAELFRRGAAPLAECLREAQTRRELPSGADANELAALLFEAFEGAVMREKVEQNDAAFRRFDRILLPRLLG